MDAEEQIARAFLANHPEEAARELERADPWQAAEVLSSLTPAVSAEVYRAIGPSHAEACAGALTDETLAAIVTWLSPDAGSAVLRRLDGDRQRAVLTLLDDDVRSLLSGKLSYPENTAGALADPLVLALPEDLTLGAASSQLRLSGSHAFDHLYVVTRERELVGALTLANLMAARPNETLASVMHRDPVRLQAHADLVTVMGHPAWSDYDALPVVDGAGRLVGVIRHRSIRRMGAPTQRPLVATLVGLSEVYWAGLSSILASLSSAQPANEENADAR